MPDFDLGTARGKIDIDSSGVTTGLASANAQVGAFKKNLAQTGGQLQRTGAIMGGIGLAAVAGIGYAVKVAADFEERMSAVGAVSGATAKEMDELRKKAMQLGADTKFSALESAQAMEELVKAGLTVEQVLNGAADATTALAAAGEIGLTEAAAIASAAMNQFKLDAEQLPQIADRIAGAANASAIEVSDFGQAMNQAGIAASTVGLSFDDLALAITAMGKQGFKGSDAGTSLKTMLLNLQPVTKKQKQLFEELGITSEENATSANTMGNAFFDANGKIENFSKVAYVLRNALDGMSEAQRLQTLELMFGTDALRAAALVAGTTTKDMDDLQKTLMNTSSADIAAKRMDNLKGALEQLRGSIDTILIQVGSPMQKSLKTFVDGLTKLVNAFGALPPGVQQFIVMAILALGVVLALSGAFLLIVGTIMKATATFRALKAALGVSRSVGMLAKAMKLLNAAFLTNPVFLVVAALVLLGVAIWQLYKRSQTFRDIVGSLGSVLKGFASTVVRVFKAIPGFIKKNWDLLLPIFLGPLGLVILIWRRFGDKIKEVAGRAVDAVVDWFAKLPARIAYWLGFIIGSVIKFGMDLAARAMELGARFVAAIFHFFLMLPTRTGELLQRVIGAVISWSGRMLATGGKMASDFVKRIVDGITKLPGRVKDIFGRIISAIKDRIVDAFNAVKSFAGNMWKGFKEGLGISSPSFIERAMSDMTANVARETKMLAAQVRTVQGIGGGIPTAGIARGAGVVGPMAGAGGSSTPAAVHQPINIEVHNPVGETAEDSIHKEMQKLAFHGVLASPS